MKWYEGRSEAGFIFSGTLEQASFCFECYNSSQAFSLNIPTLVMQIVVTFPNRSSDKLRVIRAGVALSSC